MTVVGIRWLVAQGREREADRALQILRERYARGEIGREECHAAGERQGMSASPVEKERHVG